MRKKIDIICCSTDNWDNVWRRRQHLCNEFSKKEWIENILFVEPACSIWSDLKKLNFNEFKTMGRIKKIGEKTYVFKPMWPLPFVRFNIIRKLNLNIYLNQVKREIKRIGLRNIVTWFSYPSYEHIAGKFGERLIWYDCTDDWSRMPAITKSSARMFKI